jgi:hypothetical protein
MSSDKAGLTASDKGGMPQLHTTGGNIVHPVKGLSNDAGLGNPGAPGAYGPVEDGSIPSGGKMPGGNAKAMNAWFGSANPGGGKK